MGMRKEGTFEPWRGWRSDCEWWFTPVLVHCLHFEAHHSTNCSKKTERDN